MLQNDINDSAHRISLLVEQLPPSINEIDKEQRKAQTKQIQKVLEEKAAEALTDKDLEPLNGVLRDKFYTISKNHHGKLVLFDRDNAFETTYAARFNYFLQSSNDKEQCTAVLVNFISSLYGYNTYAELIHGGVSLLDVGAGDGVVGHAVAEVLNQSGKARYIAVERDGKFEDPIKAKFNASSIPYSVYIKDFREILEPLSKENSFIILASHLYTTTPMPQFFKMMFDLLKENGMVVLAHDSMTSDAMNLRHKFGTLLKVSQRDCTKEIAQELSQQEYLYSITTTYESSLTFPELSEEDWAHLLTIKQADYTNEYAAFSEALLRAKNLIDFVISDKLEAFNQEQRTEILNHIRGFLAANRNQFKSTCAIQVVLSPHHTLECQQQFMQLKKKIEGVKGQASYAEYPKKLFQVLPAEEKRVDELMDKDEDLYVEKLKDLSVEEETQGCIA